MAVYINKYVKAARFTQEFELNDALDQIIPKVTPGSTIGDAIADAIEASGGGTVVTVGATKAGSKIADLVINGTATPINETITAINTFSANPATGVITLEYTDEAGVKTTKSVTTSNVGLGSMQSAGHTIGSVTINGVVTPIKETVTTVARVGDNLVFTNEDGVQTTIALGIAGTPDPVTSVTNTKTGNRIATHTNEAGTAVDINETVTSVTRSGSVLSFVNEAGVTTSFDIKDAETTTTVSSTVAGHKIATFINEDVVPVDINETVTVLSRAGSVISYADEAGNTTAIDIKDAETTTTVSGTVAGHKIAAYSNEEGASVDINETVTVLSRAGSVISYADEAGVTTAIDIKDAETTTTLTGALATGNTIGTFTNEEGVAVVIKESATSIALGGSVITYTGEGGLQSSVDIKSAESTTTFVDSTTGTKHKIGTYTNEDGIATDVNEVVTTLSRSGSVLTYTNENAVSTAIDIKDAETTTTLALSGGNYVFTNEDGAQTALQPANFISTDSGNAVSTGTDGKLKVIIPVQFPDDQVLSGDNTGSVALTMTPTTVGDPALGTEQTNYMVKADLKVAGTTPSANVNQLKLGASGFYVDGLTVKDEGVTKTNQAFGIDFRGALVTATNSGDDVTVTIASPDGSETKVTPGTNVTVTGAGTTASPYLVSVANAADTTRGAVALATASNYPSTSDLEATTPAYVNAALATINGSETKLVAGTNVSITGVGTTASPYVVNSLYATVYASNAENVTGTLTTKAVNPATMKYTLSTGQAYDINVSKDGYFNTVRIGKGKGDFSTNTVIGNGPLGNNTIGIDNTTMGFQSMFYNTTGNENTAFGKESLFSNTEGNNNTAIGVSSMYNNTLGTANTAVGRESLLSNTTGGTNTAVGHTAMRANTTGANNATLGVQALFSNTVGSHNTVAGVQAMYFNLNGNYNSAFGRQALYSNTTGSNNSAVGRESLYSNTTGSNNSAVGYGALRSNTVGISNVAFGLDALRSNTTGNENSAVGKDSLRSNTTGTQNAAFGARALYANTTGNSNTAVGHGALASNVVGDGNVATGYNALGLNVDGLKNVATGVQSLGVNVSGSENTGTGFATLFSNITGNSNVANGTEALYSNVDGNNNTANGTRGLFSNTSGNNNTANGDAALYSNTTGNDNTANGWSALRENTTGNNNSATGSGALYNNTTGEANTANGKESLHYNTIGERNTANGYHTLFSNDTGSNNTVSGYQSMYANLTGSHNSTYGVDAMVNNLTGSFNVAVGSSSLRNNTSGTRSTAIGTHALFTATTGAHNVAVGHFAGYNLTTGKGNVIIGSVNSSGTNSPAFDVTTEDNRVSLGSTATTNAYIQVPWTVVSDARDKVGFASVPHGLDFVSKLKPVAYRFRVSRDSDEATGPVRYGFKAQDVLALEGDTPVIVDAENPDKLRFNDPALIAVLVNAINELKAEVDALKRAK